MSQEPAQQSNRAATAALVAGILAVGFSLFVSIVAGGVMALVALLVGGFARGEARKGKGGDGVAIAGMVLGGISIAINIIVPNLLD